MTKQLSPVAGLCPDRASSWSRLCSCQGGLGACTWPGMDPKPRGHRGDSAEGLSHTMEMPEAKVQAAGRSAGLVPSLPTAATQSLPPVILWVRTGRLEQQSPGGPL